MNFTVLLATCRPTDLASTLESLSKCTLPKNFSGTIVIENGTREPTLREVVDAASPKLKMSYMHCPEGNKSNALNVAIDSLKENQLLFLTDDDVQFGKDILVHYAEAAVDHETGVVFGGKIVPDRDAPPPTELLPYIPASMKGYPVGGVPLDLTKAFFVGPNWAVFSDDVKKLGGFNPAFGPGSKLRSTGQETQMMRVMRNAGFEFVFLEDAIVKHKIEAHNYSVEFVQDRQFRAGVETGQRLRYDRSSFLGKLPPWKILVKAVLYPLLLPLVGLISSKEFYYKLLFGYHFVRGFLKAWFSKPADDNWHRESTL